MNRKLPTFALVVLLVASACSAREAMRNQAIESGNQRPTAAVPAAPAATDANLGPTDPAASVEFTVSLVLPGQPELAAFLAGLHDPNSPDFRHYLNAQAFGARFGLPSDQVDAVVAWLQSNGVTITFRADQRTSLGVKATAGVLDSLFGITLNDFQSPDGTRYHRPNREPQVPAAMDGLIARVVGLDTRPWQPAWVPPSIYGAGILHGGLRPEDVARAYEIEQLHGAGFHGEGETIAVLSLGPFNKDDIDAFDHEMGITGPPVQAIRLDNADTEPNATIGEVSLDIEVVRGIAPAAQILNYEGPPRLSSMGALMRQIVSDGKASAINISYGRCERYLDPSDIAADEQEFSAAFAAGISVFVASGDWGAYDCWQLQLNPDDQFERDVSPAVDSPSSSPSTISVGGTNLSVREDGTYFQEAGWEGPLGLSGAGGGLSTIYPRPSWQQGAGVDNANSNGMRQVPDVAGPADPATGFSIIYAEPGDQQKLVTVGGTSGASPFWVGAMAVVSQYAKTKGVNSLGALGPLLYQIAASRPDVFHDVVRGGNLLYDATPGWDYTTGLGTPRVGPLADAIISALGGQ